jgi:hypothetical protein
MSDQTNPDIAYLAKHGITSERIAGRYIRILRRAHSFINMKKIGSNTCLNTDLLKRAVMDYFVDIARIKEFHGISKVNTEKIYGYMSYWLLKRKPIQVIQLFPGSDFINELFVTSFFVASIIAEKGIAKSDYGTNTPFHKFQSLLYYNLKYRPVSQQSLELAVNAFFSGYDLV